MWFSQRTCFRVGIAILVVLVGAWASPGIVDDRYDEGVRAYQEQRYVEARDHLRAVFQDRPAYVGREGAVAYWLGRAYVACDQPDSSRWAWREGVKVLRAANVFDARLFDAHLWASVEAGAERRASRTYLNLLSRLGTGTEPSEVGVLRRHAAQLRPVLDKTQMRQLLTTESDVDTPAEWAFVAGAGAQVSEWWHRQDPLPATEHNERVVEHLRRIDVAEDNFAASDQVDRLDDRGETFVRLGAPARRTEVPFTDLNFLQEVFRSGVPLDRSAFPENEIWTYSHIDDAGKYLFVSKNGTYTLGTAADLLPELLRGPFSSSGRSQNIAYSSQAAIRHIYEHLSMKYNDRGSVYDGVMEWFAFQESQRSLSNMRDNLGRGTAVRTVGYGSGARRVYRSPSNGWPSGAARNSVRSIREQERIFAEVRRESMPAVFTGVDTTVERLPIRMRAGRFLDEEGNTETVVDWGGSALRDTLAGMGPFRLELTTVQYKGGGQDTTTQWPSITQLPPEQEARPVWSTRLPGAKGKRLQAAFQWDLYSGSPPDSSTVRGRQIRRIDTLRALSADPTRLEMSDLRPMVLPQMPVEEADRIPDAATPYPFRSVPAGTPLLLSFEVYHLTYGEQDRTQYTVEYELLRREERGGLLGLFLDDRETRTSTASTYAGTSRRTDEYILLDWGSDPPEEPQPVTVTVRVTDETTGQVVERSINFRLLPPNASGEASTRVVSGRQ